MIALDNLNEATQKVLEAVDCINQEVNNEIFEKAPIMIHQRFCGQLVGICTKKENENKTPKQIPEAMEVLTAIKVLEELYPKLKDSYPSNQ